jgi:hypothetical protein
MHARIKNAQTHFSLIDKYLLGLWSGGSLISSSNLITTNQVDGRPWPVYKASY